MIQKKINYLLLSLGVILISTGCMGPFKQYPAYMQPVDSERMAKLMVNKDALIANYAFPLEIKMIVNNQVIDDSLYPDLNVNVAEGSHKIFLDITTFYHGYEAKYNITKVYDINLEEGETYIVSAKVDKERLEDVNDSVEVFYSIQGKNTLIQDKIVLEDSEFRTRYGGTSGHNENKDLNLLNSILW